MRKKQLQCVSFPSESQQDCTGTLNSPHATTTISGGRQLPSRERVPGKSFKAVTQSMQIHPRLLNGEVYNRVFKNGINIGARLPA